MLSEKEKKYVALALHGLGHRGGPAVFAEMQIVANKLDIREQFDHYADEWAKYEHKQKSTSISDAFAKLREITSGHWDQFNTDEVINRALGRTDD